MAVVSMKQLLESGVHFGHATRRWNPKMAPYIFTSRNGIYIIDLKRTAKEIEIAYQAMLDIVQNGGKVLFVGTKKQAQESIRDEAVRSGQFYVNQRWLGGTLTNFKTIRRRIKLLHDLYKMEEDGVFDKLPKKEVLTLKNKRDRLEKFLGGIKEMKKVPEAVYIVDPRKERNAILEARKLGIKVFGIVDSNCDPDDVDYIIPGNDDAIRAVRLITHVMANAVIEAQGGEVETVEDEPVNSAPRRPRREQTDREPRRKPEERHTEKPAVKETQSEPEVKAEQKTEQPAPEKIVEEPVKDVTKAPEQEAPAPKRKEEEKTEAAEETKQEAAPADEKESAATSEKMTEEQLNDMTVAELKDLARERELTGFSSLKKAELIEALLK